MPSDPSMTWSFVQAGFKPMHGLHFYFSMVWESTLVGGMLTCMLRVKIHTYQPTDRYVLGYTLRCDRLM